MKLRKIELALEGDEFWPKLSIVHVAGTASAAPIKKDMSQDEAEKIIRTWDKAAILKVTPADSGALVGFWMNNNACQYLNVPVETTGEGLFAMRIGDADVDFFVLPKDHKTNYTLKLVEVTDIEDQKYSGVCLY